MARSRKAAEQLVYQIKVTLKDSKPLICRRVQVTDSTTLARLHGIPQAVMDWEDCHLHEFTVAGTQYGTLDADYDVFAAPGAESGVTMVCWRRCEIRSIPSTSSSHNG